jgi:hypothetical protein
VPTSSRGAISTATSAEEVALATEIRRRRLQSDLSHAALAGVVGYSREYVRRAERVGADLPSQQLVAALDNALRADGILIVAWQQASAARERRRRRPLTGRAGRANVSGDVAVDPPATMSIESGALDGWELPVLAPASVDESTVAQVRSLTAALAGSDNLHGGGLAAALAPGAMRWATGLLGAAPTAGPATRCALFEAVGNLAEVVAFIAFDVADHGATRRLFSFALDCAKEAGSWPLRAAVLADTARHLVATGQHDAALETIEFAQVRQDRLTPTARAMTSVVRAQILGVLDRHDDARAEIERADAAFADRRADVDPPWLVYYDEAEHAGSTARALIPLDVRGGRLGVAAARLTAAVGAHTAAYPRSRAFSAVRLARLQMRVGDPTEAAATAALAIRHAAPLQSRRLTAEVQSLAAATNQHRAVPAVAQLCDALHDALTTHSA